MIASLVRVVRRAFEPVPSIDDVFQAIALVATLILGGTFIGVRVDGLLGVSVTLAVLLILVSRAAYVLQREMDTRAELRLGLNPNRAQTPAWIESLQFQPAGQYCCIEATICHTQTPESCEGRIIACERFDEGQFVPYEHFVGVLELRWAKEPLGHSIEIEPGVPEALVVCVGVEDGDRVFLGGSTDSLGRSVEVPHGLYRVRVRLRPVYSSQAVVPDEAWFCVEHRGAWNEVRLSADQVSPSTATALL